MLTRIKVRNFKKLDDVEFELGKSVVLIGPNNSGKTTSLQALALWNSGLTLWNAKRKGRTSPEKRSGITINRRDLIAIPVPIANLLWKDLHVRDIKRLKEKTGTGKQKIETKNILVDIVVEGITNGNPWKCGLEFDYANSESFYCRPLRISNGDQPKRMPIPDEASNIKVAFLPPMSGLASTEAKYESGKINVLIGEGQTAQVLRNICFQIAEKDWQELINHIKRLFGVTLLAPQYIEERGEITMAYKEPNGIQLDLSSSGRGLQQTLLLLAYLYANPRTVLLLDEPAAHLEVLRQRQTYQLITDIAEQKGSQIIAASHSEVVLNEAADRDMVIAFVGKPHRIDDRGSQVLKSLKEIGFEHYYLAEETGWILYVEGSTDLAILKILAKLLNHAAAELLERPFVHYIGSNIPEQARQHFFGLQEAKKDLVGIALFDRLDKSLQEGTPLKETMWQKREIENYLCMEDVLLAYARHDIPDDLFGVSEKERRVSAMRESIDELTSALKTLRKATPWSPDIKATDDFLDPLFDKFFEKLNLPNILRKTDYHVLARFVPKDKIDPEIVEKLDAIVKAAEKAKPRVD